MVINNKQMSVNKNVDSLYLVRDALRDEDKIEKEESLKDTNEDDLQSD